MFLASTSAASAGAASLFPAWAVGDERVSSRVVAGKDRRLIVHTSGIAVLETPSELLDERITPLDRLFVRNNQQPEAAATLKSVALEGWEIELAGLVDSPRVFDASELSRMKQVDREMVLQCSGNGRALFSQTVKTKGTQWVRGGMGNIRVSGVPLSSVLDKLGVDVKESAAYVTAEGRDTPPPAKEDFEHSLPVEDVLNNSLLALRFNDQPIPAIHGGPVRFITPGYYGTMHMKWLSRLRFEAHETDNYNHIPRYRIPRRPIQPGEPIKYTFENSQPSWRMKVKSVVLSPQPEDSVAANRKLRVRGVAFNDGSTPIEVVLASVDQGRTWTRTKLEAAQGRYAWYRWTWPVTLLAGRHEIWTRAVDALGRSQPLDGSIHWNPSGYEWNGVEKVPVVAS